MRGTRGIQLFLEYYGNPEANEKSFTADGFFRTGDRVRVGDGGAIFYSERDKDMLSVGGENEAPALRGGVCGLNVALARLGRANVALARPGAVKATFTQPACC